MNTRTAAYSHYMPVLFVLFILLCGYHLSAQTYPQNYFRNPLDIPIQLAANFGEIRSNHFHMGFDIRTQQKENLPVYASADGYISHIRIEKYGYGRAIFIKHPNGYTTVYGHLNDFFPQLNDYVKQKQYADKSWEQDFDVPASLFPVSQGQFIAYSGNTGGSEGPHLHFEIRNSKTDQNLNPELFGLITDNVYPTVNGLYMYDRRYSTYLASPVNIAVKKKGKTNNYRVTGDTVKSGSQLVSFGIRAQDKNTPTSFNYGIYSASLFMDDLLVSSFALNDFSYDDSRYINACIDYTKYKTAKTGIQYLFKLPGNKLNIYTPTPMHGVVILADTLPHRMNIAVSDVTGNTDTVSFILKYDKNKQKDIVFPPYAKPCTADALCNIESASAKVQFSKDAFYDVVPFMMSELPPSSPVQVSNGIMLHNYTVPVHDYYTVMIKTNLAANDALRKKSVVQLKYGDDSILSPANWQGDYCTAKFKTLGTVSVLVDTTAPVISVIGFKDSAIIKAQKSISIKCTDNLNQTKNFTALLDGNWLLFSKKGNTCTYVFDEHCMPGSHTLHVSVSDIAGNISEKDFVFTKEETE